MEEMREKLIKMLEASDNKITDEIVSFSQKLDKIIVLEQRKKVGVV